MIPALRSVLLAGAVMTLTHGANAQASHTILDFNRLDSWAQDDHAEALEVFVKTCPDLDDPDWRSLCALAQQQSPESARAFFELFFRPVLIEDGDPALFTGYFEPELDGARQRTERFRYPIHRMPPEARASNPWLPRREILTSGVMEGRGLEIAWVDDPVELFFLQIQGSGRIRLPDGRRIRVGYGGANGHPYRSIGVELVRRGIFEAHQVSAEVIRNWVRRNPEAGPELLFHNTSYVFFRELPGLTADEGPRGAMNRSVTTLRSVAVDPAFTPLGAPVWVEKDGRDPMRRLMIAQDTGSAIKGAQRADIFFGTGDAAGQAAGQLRDPGRMVVLLPIQRAYALLPDGF
ncbi:membrane-bound lytic murein transglycosylase A [Cribrihabitans marinus]|uniref:peptidoglycan lytic exotransglycosylase n=1 Tax=Cribrihabitans marinus TaxID=1227549 RepID=A0A1H6YJ10_9RHOB|nr:murein transglycosylase A [Cribrihabitans marinus]GGH29197.1 murein transglycosylase [Cribrihabitans marinus]SEJ40396.1 membrane-bound lytic murein transglycosylase A [Cribrihabitans marinus]